MTSRKSFTAIALATAAILLVSACGESSDTEDTATPGPQTTTASPAAPASPAPAPAEGPTITIEGFKYTDVTVAPGAQITVVNNDSAEHSVTSDTAGTFDVHVDGKQKATLIAPTQPGTYPFFCTYHPSMRGVLTVR